MTTNGAYHATQRTGRDDISGDDSRGRRKIGRTLLVLYRVTGDDGAQGNPAAVAARASDHRPHGPVEPRRVVAESVRDGRGRLIPISPEPEALERRRSR
ncbi:MAG: hypothetical protein GY719_10690 [bacterium]|nr:hypothetical protein [bacterium]